jgi:CBS domain-containing protein
LTDRIRLARDTTVEDCQALLGIEPLLVDVDAPLLDVVRSAARQPATRLIGVVDGGRIVGVVPVTRVAESVVARVAPEALLIDVEDDDSAVSFSRSFEDRTAREIMLPPAVATPRETLGQAFRVMHERRLGGLYVVDEAGRPTGYLDLLELAVVYADALTGHAERGSSDAGAGGAGGAATGPTA